MPIIDVVRLQRKLKNFLVDKGIVSPRSYLTLDNLDALGEGIEGATRSMPPQVGIPGFLASKGMGAAVDVAKNVDIDALMRGIKEYQDVFNLSVLPLAKRSAVSLKKLSHQLEIPDIMEFLAKRYQREDVNFPFSRGGREATYFKAGPAKSGEIYSQFSDNLVEGGPVAVIVKARPKNPLVLHKRRIFDDSGHTLERLLGERGFRELSSFLSGGQKGVYKGQSSLNKWKSITTSKDVDILIERLSKLTGESKNKLKDLKDALNFQRTQATYQGDPYFLVKDFLMHNIAKKKGYDSIIRNTFGSGELDFETIGKGNASTITDEALAMFKAKRKGIKKSVDKLFSQESIVEALPPKKASSTRATESSHTNLQALDKPRVSITPKWNIPPPKTTILNNLLSMKKPNNLGFVAAQNHQLGNKRYDFDNSIWAKKALWLLNQDLDNFGLRKLSGC